MGFDPTSRRLLGTAAGGLGSLSVAGCLVGVREEIASANVALLLMVVVLGAAHLGGRAAGAMSGLVAAAAFDFFHAQPYGVLKIGGVNDLVTALLLVLAGLAMGEIAERAAASRRRLRDDERQLRRLHRVARLAASGEQDERDLVLSIAAELADAVPLEDCRFELPPFASELPRLDPAGTMSEPSRRHGHGGFPLPAEGVDLRVVGPHGTIGRFVLTPVPGVPVSTEQLLVALALAHGLGLALAPATS